MRGEKARRGGRGLLIVLVFAVVSTGMISCSSIGTVDHSERAPLRGCVRDESGLAVQSARVHVGEHEPVATGPDGSFLIDDIPLGHVDIIVSAPGHERYAGAFVFAQPTQIMHVRLLSGSHILERAVELAEAGRLRQALESIERALLVQPDDCETRFAAALISYLNGDSETARHHLDLLPEARDSAPVQELRSHVGFGSEVPQ